ncbi:hypothetical protein C8Q77DRAFT_1156299 [Trametes polyzona]|nr:hypothetical protein C8Q77DRAFT_1156299 [Trametes polyzona]
MVGLTESLNPDLLQSLHKDTPPPAPSTLLQKLAQAHKSKEKATPAVPEASKRSSAFSSRPPEIDASSNAARDEDLALVEDLTLGPSEHTPPFDDPHFEKLEPNSGIRLSSRVIPHEDFQDYLRGRYYISSSKLYSVVRLLLSKQGYDVATDHLVGGTRAS